MSYIRHLFDLNKINNLRSIFHIKKSFFSPWKIFVQRSSVFFHIVEASSPA